MSVVRFGPLNFKFVLLVCSFAVGVWWIVLVGSGGLTCGLVRVQIFVPGMRMVRSGATVIFNGKVAVCLMWGRLLASLLLWVAEEGHCLWVCMCVRVKSGSRSVVSHCMFLLFPQMRSLAFGSCTARSSGEPRFLMVGRSRKTGQHSRTVHPGKWNSIKNTCRQACLLLTYKHNIFLDTFPKWKIRSKKITCTLVKMWISLLQSHYHEEKQMTWISSKEWTDSFRWGHS